LAETEKSDRTRIPLGIRVGSPYSILGVLPLDQIADVAPRNEDPKQLIRVITFELTQHIRPRYINVTDRQTDGQTDG